MKILHLFWAVPACVVIIALDIIIHTIDLISAGLAWFASQLCMAVTHCLDYQYED